MAFFCDTSILHAASNAADEHHARSLARVAAALKEDAFCSAHSLAELYSSLTATPTPAMRRVQDVLVGVEETARLFKPVSLTTSDYLWTIRHVAAAGGRSGLIYDALILKCAEKARVSAIYTLNVAHFMRIAWPAVSPLIRAP